jgi:hypothetical protein
MACKTRALKREEEEISDERAGEIKLELWALDK